MRTTRQAGLAVFASILTWVGPFTRMAFAQPAPQPAPVRPVTEMLHGVAVTDPVLVDGRQRSGTD